MADPPAPLAMLLRPLLLIVIAALAGAPAARAQVTDDFSDGDFVTAPAWTGDVERWTVGLLDGSRALRSDGLSARDTVHLAVPSTTGFGRWTFRFAHRGVNLSSYNGARVYLVADADRLDGPVHGYFVQLGTNNSDEVRLYRQDGDPATARVVLARTGALLDGEASDVAVVVTRDPGGTWTLTVDDGPPVSTADATYAQSRYFGIWVKHTAAGRAAFYLDDVDVRGLADRVDRTPPGVRLAAQTGPGTLDVYFDEAVDPASLVPAAFHVDRASARTVTPLPPAAARLHFASAIEGTVLTVIGVRDLQGNTLAEARVPIARRAQPGDVVINEIMAAPRRDDADGRPAQPEYFEVANRTAHGLTLDGWYWTNQSDARATADTVDVGAGRAALPPGGYAVVYAHSGGAAGGPAEVLLRAFPGVDTTAATAILLPLPRTTLRLRNDGGLLRLHGGDGAVLDEVAYDAAWHVPELADARGIALERIDRHGPSSEPGNWTSSRAVAGGTPGRPNSVVPAALAPDEARGLTVSPSPFSRERDGVTVIRYVLPGSGGLVRCHVFDAAGRLVRTLARALLSGATGQLRWDGRDDAGHPLPVGIYVVYLEVLDTPHGRTEAYKAVVVLAQPLG